ncbi:hypothetical protein Bbelb_319970 [Branchiostoma belcheri]|nr:hypothetical protein Bbelb_319970 [Branchiostoma belcheri]
MFFLKTWGRSGISKKRDYVNAHHSQDRERLRAQVVIARTAGCAPHFTSFECTHTNLEYQQWWKVDLGDTYVISHVTVINRGDCCGERLKDFMIRVGHNEDISKNEQCGDTYTDIPEDGEIVDIQCTTPISGRTRERYVV